MSYIYERLPGGHHEIGSSCPTTIEPAYAQFLEILIRLEEDLLQFGFQAAQSISVTDVRGAHEAIFIIIRV